MKFQSSWIICLLSNQTANIFMFSPNRGGSKHFLSLSSIWVEIKGASLRCGRGLLSFIASVMNNILVGVGVLINQNGFISLSRRTCWLLCPDDWLLRHLTVTIVSGNDFKMYIKVYLASMTLRMENFFFVFIFLLLPVQRGFLWAVCGLISYSWFKFEYLCSALVQFRSTTQSIIYFALYYCQSWCPCVYVKDAKFS